MTYNLFPFRFHFQTNYCLPLIIIPCSIDTKLTTLFVHTKSSLCWLLFRHSLLMFNRGKETTRQRNFYYKLICFQLEVNETKVGMETTEQMQEDAKNKLAFFRFCMFQI